MSVCVQDFNFMYSFVHQYNSSQFYEKEAFLLDEERASMLPMTAAGEVMWWSSS